MLEGNSNSFPLHNVAQLLSSCHSTSNFIPSASLLLLLRWYFISLLACDVLSLERVVKDDAIKKSREKFLIFASEWHDGVEVEGSKCCLRDELKKKFKFEFVVQIIQVEG